MKTISTDQITKSLQTELSFRYNEIITTKIVGQVAYFETAGYTANNERLIYAEELARKINIACPLDYDAPAMRACRIIQAEPPVPFTPQVFDGRGM